MDWFDEDKLAVPPYMLEHWQRQINLIGQLAQFTNDIVCVEGEAGVGKTTFIKQLALVSPANLLCRVLDGKQIDSLAAMMHDVADAFGLSWSGNSESSQTFSSADQTPGDNHMTWLLLVDDADQLTPEHWQALIELASQSSDPLQHLHLVLTGDLGFGAKLLDQVRTLERQKLHRLKLERMTPEESLKLLEHILHHQGIDTHHLSQKPKKQIVALAKGSPQKIVEALLPMLRSHHLVGGNILKDVSKHKNKYLWLAVGAIAFFGIYGIFQVGSEPSQNTLEHLLPTQAKMQGMQPTEKFMTGSMETPTDPLAENLEQALASLKDKQETGGSLPADTTASITTETPTAFGSEVPPATSSAATPEVSVSTGMSNVNAAVTEPTAQTMTMVTTTVTTEAAANPEAFSTDATAPVMETASTVPADDTLTELSQSSVATSSMTEAINALPTESTTVAATAKAAPQTTAAAQAPSAAVSKKAQAKATTAKSTSSTKKQKLSSFEQHLLTQKGSHYTIQILAAGQEKTVKSMMNQPIVSKQGGYYRRGQGGNQKFVMVVGSYATRAEAQHALETLPPEIRKLNPFIRNLSQIKQEVAATSKVKSANNG